MPYFSPIDVKKEKEGASADVYCVPTLCPALRLCNLIGSPRLRDPALICHLVQPGGGAAWPGIEELSPDISKPFLWKRGCSRGITRLPS